MVLRLRDNPAAGINADNQQALLQLQGPGGLLEARVSVAAAQNGMNTWFPRTSRTSDPSDCVVCLGDFSDTQPVGLACGHLWHRECLNQASRIALKSRSNWPARYRNGRKGLDTSAMYEYLEEDVQHLLAERGKEFDTPNPIYYPSCTKFVPTSGLEVPWTSCCVTAICVKCAEPRSEHLTPLLGDIICPDKLSPEDRTLVEKTGWKSCPTCRHRIERREGCNLMQCSSCKTRFCYKCGRTRDVTERRGCGLWDFEQPAQAQGILGQQAQAGLVKRIDVLRGVAIRGFRREPPDDQVEELGDPPALV